MLKHLPRSGMDFLLHIFNLSWSLHSFPFIWKTSSIIPIHKMGKPLDSPASFRPISLTSCISKLFERIILSRLLFFLESNSILSSRQAGFRPGRSTLDQILYRYLSQSISDGFNKPRPGSAEACAVLHALCWSRRHQQVCHFSSVLLVSDSRSVLTTLSSVPSFLLSQTLWQIWHELSSLSSCSIRLKWVPGHSFFPRKDAADKLARRGALLVPSAIPCSFSPLIFRIHSCLFSDWRRTVSSKYFDTQVPSISIEELVLPRHARCVLSRLCCNGHSLLLGSYLSKIGRIENFSCSACGHSPQDTSHLILHCPATDSLRRSLFGDSLSLYDLWSGPWRVVRLLGLHGLPPCLHPSETVG